LQKLGEQLVALSPEQHASIDISNELRKAVIAAAKIKKETLCELCDSSGLSGRSSQSEA